jgi:hypothetical protein
MNSEFSLKDYKYNKEKAIKYIHTPKGDFYLGTTVVILHALLNIKEEMSPILKERMDIVFNPNRELISTDFVTGQTQIHQMIYE